MCDILNQTSSGKNITINSTMKLNTSWQLSGMDIQNNIDTYNKYKFFNEKDPLQQDVNSNYSFWVFGNDKPSIDKVPPE